MQQSQQVLLNDGFFQDIYLCLCSKGKSDPGQCLGPVIRFHYTFYYVIAGKGWVRLDKKTYVLSPGQGLLIPPNRSVFYEADKTEPWQYLQIGFSGQRIRQIFSAAGLETISQPFLCSDSRKLEALTEQLLQSPKGTFDQQLYRQFLLCSVLSLLVKDRSFGQSKGIQSRQNTYIEKALNYIAEHYFESSLINNMASYLGITRNYLFLLFKENLGCSPSAYVIQFRLERAGQLLQQTELSLEDIASSCGYQEPAVFSKAFKKKYGMSPSYYRKIALDKKT